MDARNTSEVILPAKSPYDWYLRHLFIEIADDITDEGFERLKFVFKGKGGFGRGRLEKLTRLEMLNLLQDNDFINSDDLLYLQVCLQKHAAQKVYRFAQLRKGILHFDPPLMATVNGHRLSGVHVRGKDFTVYSEEEIEKLISRVNEIASVPALGNQSEDISLYIHHALPQVDDETDATDFDLSEERRKQSYFIRIDVGVQKDAPREEDIQNSFHEIENRRLERENLDLKEFVEELMNELRILKLQIMEHSKEKQELLDEVSKAKEEVADYALEVVDLEKYIDEATEIRARECAGSRRSSNEEKQLESQLKQMKQELQRLETEFNTYKFGMETEKKALEDRHDLTKTSLQNVQNEKQWNEFGDKMQKLSSMSIAVKKVYGNFVPAHEPIAPTYDEQFKQSFTAKIGRLFPQIYQRQQF